MSIIPTPQFGEILKEELLSPLNITADCLAKGIDVPVSRIQDILHNCCEINADLSAKLGRFFGESDRYFLNLQSDIDVRNAELDHKTENNRIKKISP